MRNICWALFFAFTVGCATVEDSMSGKIGCPAGEIQIVSSSPGLGFGTSTWTAQCRGQTFYCSLDTAREGESLDDMSCTKSLKH